MSRRGILSDIQDDIQEYADSLAELSMMTKESVIDCVLNNFGHGKSFDIGDCYAAFYDIEKRAEDPDKRLKLAGLLNELYNAGGLDDHYERGQGRYKIKDRKILEDIRDQEHRKAIEDALQYAQLPSQHQSSQVASTHTEPLPANQPHKFRWDWRNWRWDIIGTIVVIIGAIPGWIVIRPIFHTDDSAMEIAKVVKKPPQSLTPVSSKDSS